MKPVSFFNVAAAQVANHPVSVVRVRGNFNGTGSPAWLMFFDVKSQAINIPVPANGTQPTVPAIPLNPTAPFFIETEIGNLEILNGLYMAVSTTQETLTLSTDKMDLEVELSDPEAPTGTTFVGSLSATADNVIVYATDPNKNLYSIDGICPATPFFLMLFTYPNPTNGDTPLMQWTFAASQTRNLAFGINGIHPISGASGSQTEGAYLYVSSTANIVTKVIGSGFALRAEFK